jgi:long-chain acyl-CoA synthetase
MYTRYIIIIVLLLISDVHLLYDSGTTGEQKGVMMAHSTVLATIAGYKKIADEAPSHGPTSFLSYLPLAHMMERVSHLNNYDRGDRFGFFKGVIIY